MRTLMGKLRSRRGESLVEVLAAVLVCALSVLLLASASMAAGNINHTASDHDETYYEALNHAEARDAVVDSEQMDVTVDPGTSKAGSGPVQVNVTLYGDEDEGVYSFAAVPGGGGGP